MADQQDAEQVRAKTKEIANRAKSDSSFAEQLKNDPAGTLKAEGLPEQAIGELTKQSGGDVSGYSLYEVDTCVYYTNYVEYEIYCTYYTS
jgi:hypothetical protein